MKSHIKNLLGATLIAFSSLDALAQTAHLQFDQTYWAGYNYSIDETYTPENSNMFSVTQYPTTSGANDTATVIFNMGLGTNWTFLRFSTAQLNAPLTVGHYENSMRPPIEDPGHPGFDIGYNNSGNNSVWGTFDITELSYSADGKIDTFAATFDVSGGPGYGAVSDTYKGTFTYTAAVPELSSGPMMLIGLGAIAAGVTTRRRGLAA